MACNALASFLLCLGKCCSVIKILPLHEEDHSGCDRSYEKDNENYKTGSEGLYLGFLLFNELGVGLICLEQVVDIVLLALTEIEEEPSVSLLLGIQIF